MAFCDKCQTEVKRKDIVVTCRDCGDEYCDGCAFTFEVREQRCNSCLDKLAEVMA